MSAVDAVNIAPPNDSVAAKPRAGTRERVDYIEYFRAVAIVMIVSGHAFDLAWTHSLAGQAVVGKDALSAIAALVNGGTLYFVFISGFLYRLVFYQRTGYGDFMRKKALAVGLPYLILGTPLAIFQMVASGYHVTLFRHGKFLGENYFLDIITQLSTGEMMTAYWYIPFIFLVFAASPLFDRFIRLPQPWRIAILLVSVAVAFWVHRPYESLNPFHSFVYFVNMYLFGILFCEQRHRLMPILRSPLTLVSLGLLLLVVTVSQDMIFHSIGNIERAQGDGWAPKGFDLIIVQKYVGVLFFCGLLARWGDHLAGLFRPLADASFGMFFLHGTILAALGHLPPTLAPHFDFTPANFFLYAFTTIVAAYLLVRAVKALLGARSRYLIGS